MRKTLLLILFICLYSATASPQEKGVLLIIDGKEITLDEFERSYQKNNNLASSSRLTREQYLDLYINFRLKVLEAGKLGMDTLPAFRNELSGYISQLARPYLTDTLIYEQMLIESYERMKNEIRASHIMIRVDPKSDPDDTLKAFRKISEIREKVMNGEDFNQVALTYSEDPSAINNHGSLGWFGAFRMVYQFESAAYTTSVGQVSQPVRTSYGYHIIKVHETRPALPALLAAHIFVRSPENFSDISADSARRKAFELCEKIQKGEKFEEIAKSFSDDKNTGANGGMLPWFSSGDMIPEFYDATNSIKEVGQVSEPVKTFYGWHIIKLHGRKEIKSFPEERKELIKLYNGNDRAPLKERLFIDKLKKEYNYIFYPENYSIAYDFVDPSVFEGRWNDSLLIAHNATIFTIGEKKYTLLDFGRYISAHQRATNPYNVRIFTDDQYREFSDSRILDYETEMLQQRNPDFGAIVREYHDGILLFNLTDSIVWSKAISDTIGLEKFYRKNKSRYKWGERAEVLIVESQNTDTIKMVRDLAVKYGKSKKFNADLIRDELFHGDSAGRSLNIRTGLFERGDNPDLDKIAWKRGSDSVIVKNDNNEYIFVKQKHKPRVKKFQEVKGMITSDYQEYLEKKWIASLREKYPFTVNKEVLKKVRL